METLLLVGYAVSMILFAVIVIAIIKSKADERYVAKVIREYYNSKNEIEKKVF